jgi:alkylated DNA repair dioxygenase AlkB
METIIHRDGDEETFLISISNILTPDTYEKLLLTLKTLDYRKGFTDSGTEVPREQLWFHNENKYFCERWIARYPRWDAHPYPDVLREVQDLIQERINQIQIEELHKPTINSCLVNYYRNGDSCIHPHRDNKNSFGERPTIVGISIGAPRKLVLTHISKKDVQYELELDDNSMFIMAGGSQRNFLHGIPFDPECSKERWSLTFREHVC